MRTFLFLSLIAVSTLTGAHAAELSKDCQAFVKSLPSDYKWDLLEAPLDYKNPGTEKVQIFYYWNAAATGTPTVFLHGGPIADSHLSFEHLRQAKRTQAPLVFFDQRGGGCSSAAPEKNFQVRNWGTEAHVRDAEGIRKKIFGEARRWNVLGHSYGAIAAFRYLTLFPESLVSVHTYGNAVMRNAVAHMDAMMDGQNRIFTQNFEKAFPGNLGLMQGLTAAIDPAKCSRILGAHRELCGTERLNAFTTLLSTINEWEAVNLWVGAVASQYSFDGKPVPVKVDESALSNFVVENVFWDPRGESALSDAIYAFELTPGMTSQEACGSALAKNPRKGETINQCRFWMSVLAGFKTGGADGVVPEPVQIENVRKVLRAHPDLNVYSYSAENDYRIPVEVYAEMNAVLADVGNYHYQMAAGRDHVGYAGYEVLWDQLTKGAAF